MSKNVLKLTYEHLYFQKNEDLAGQSAPVPWPTAHHEGAAVQRIIRRTAVLHVGTTRGDALACFK